MRIRIRFYKCRNGHQLFSNFLCLRHFLTILRESRLSELLLYKLVYYQLEIKSFVPFFIKIVKDSLIRNLGLAHTRDFFRTQLSEDNFLMTNSFVFSTTKKLLVCGLSFKPRHSIHFQNCLV